MSLDIEQHTINMYNAYRHYNGGENTILIKVMIFVILKYF